MDIHCACDDSHRVQCGSLYLDENLAWVQFGWHIELLVENECVPRFASAHDAPCLLLLRDFRHSGHVGRVSKLCQAWTRLLRTLTLSRLRVRSLRCCLHDCITRTMFRLTHGYS